MKNLKPFTTSRCLLIGGVLLLGSFWGCASTGKMETPSDCRKATCLAQQGKAPEWIVKPQVYSGDKGKIYGVGNASMVKNSGLLRRNAEAQARREIAAFLGTDVEAMLVAYANSTTAGEGDVSSESQDVEDVLRTLTKEELVGAKILEFWENPYQSEAYALARLDTGEAFDSILAGLEKSKKMSDSQIKEIKQRRKEFIDDLDRRIEKKSR